MGLARTTRLIIVGVALWPLLAAVPPQRDAEQRYSAAESAFADGNVAEALQRFDDLIEEYPTSAAGPWRSAARVRAGEIELGLGRSESAAVRFVRVIDGETQSSWTSRARVGLASSLLQRRQWPAAAALLQQTVDALAADDASGDLLAATIAAERLTLLHRVWLRTASGGQPWRRTVSLDLSTPLDRPIGIAVGANGVLISDEGNDGVVFRDSGGNAATFAMQNPQRPWWSDQGEGYVAARQAVNAPLSATSLQFTYDDNGRRRAVEDIRAGLRTPAGDWLLLDNDTDRVMLFDNGGAYLRSLDLQAGEPVDVARGPGGRLLVIERDRREVMVFDADGALQGAFAIDGWREPYALSVDPAGHVYVLDRGRRRVDVFDPDGGILWTIGPVLPGGAELDDPRDIAVDGSGRVLIADRGLGVIVVVE